MPIEIIFREFITDIDSKGVNLVFEMETIAAHRRSELLVHRRYYKIFCGQNLVRTFLIRPLGDS